MTSSGQPKGETSPGTPRANHIAKAGWTELFQWLVRRRLRFRVSGHSMSPLLNPGDEVLVDPNAPYDVGDVLVSRHPFKRDVNLVKLLVGFDDRGRARLEGLNDQQSTDSRSLGAFSRRLIWGRVTSRMTPPSV